MLVGVDAILTGVLLKALDDMGHGDAVVIADAHFTAKKLAKNPVIEMPGLSTPRVLQAIRSVFVPDEYEPYQLGLMECPGDQLLEVQTELVDVALLDSPTISTGEKPANSTAAHVRLLDRQAFYDRAAQAELIIRTGETRIYGNALFFKGVTPVLTT
ncbi:MAG: hypothetical protein LBG99_08440 [Propionibacteriaceae bacterium]|nr:hypothetical protein [Propionibacteriaceae bacterium]